MSRLPSLALCALLAGLLARPAAAQQALVRPASEATMPGSVDSNSPAFWRDGKLLWFTSHGGPRLFEADSQFGPRTERPTALAAQHNWPCWIESVYPEDNGMLWGWYHTEPIDLIPGTTLTAPKIGALVSFDGGATMRDLGIVLESGDPLDPTVQNGYFAGGHGDFTVILDRERTYFYFFFDNYGGSAESQGVCLARMAYADRGNPEGKVWKYHNGTWQEAGRGGRTTPIFRVATPWQSATPDALWGPSVHWNSYLNCYVMLLNRAQGEPGWSQEGVYVSFATDLSRPDSWTQPRKILDRSQFDGWYFFYPQVMGLEAGGTDRRAGQVARLYVGGVSRWEIEFAASPSAPTGAAVTAPADVATLTVGQAVTLSASAAGVAPFAYQWYKDDVAIPLATAATYTIASASLADAGVYTVVISNAYGATTSGGFTLAVSAPVVATPAAPAMTSFLTNLSVCGTLASERATLTLGFVLQGSAKKSLVLRALGPALAAFGVGDAAVDPRLDLYDPTSTLVAGNDNWLAADAPAFAAVGAFPLAAGSADAGLVFVAEPGAATAAASATGAGVALVEIYDPAPAADSRLVNLSARGVVSASAPVIGGFAIGGTGAKRLLVRALGPQLAALGVTKALSDPLLELYDSNGALIAANDDWDAAEGATHLAAGALALAAGSRDAGLVVDLPAGRSYTAQVRSRDGSKGEVLLELYELP